MSNQLSIPLFPLNTVLFPGGPLPLKIFETRYLDMISRCLREDSPFGVCLLLEGGEVGGGARFCEVGTLAKVIDWDQLDNGLLGITALGQQRFRIIRRAQQADQLHVGEVELLAAEASISVPAEYAELTALLEKFLEDVGGPYAQIPCHYEDASWVGCRLAELLPMPYEQRQHLMEMSEPVLRLHFLSELLDALRKKQ